VQQHKLKPFSSKKKPPTMDYMKTSCTQNYYCQGAVLTMHVACLL
jgi:hypothetical protein